jgi:hypothetical protein
MRCAARAARRADRLGARELVRERSRGHLTGCGHLPELRRVGWCWPGSTLAPSRRSRRASRRPRAAGSYAVHPRRRRQRSVVARACRSRRPARAPGRRMALLAPGAGAVNDNWSPRTRRGRETCRPQIDRSGPSPRGEWHALPSSADTSLVFGGRPSTTSASMLLPFRGSPLNVAVIVGSISATGVPAEGFSNSARRTLFG